MTGRRDGPGPGSDTEWLRRAVDLSRRCPPSPTAFSVGAILVAADGRELARGYSRQDGGRVHAEEAALRSLGQPRPGLRDATLYTSLEPCTRRASSPSPCTRLVLEAGIGRVVVAWREPPLFVADCTGVETLRAAGVEVVCRDELAEAARAVNRHLLPSGPAGG
ncbi:cytidine/deoxycytidylate deaminase family protein [Streptomyces dubilierae]|uniref:dCMP deaminase n=1 Tax=Streptomyces dubilierae TaxID=3075533 RepID=A0ABU2PGM3_9ACTN|nr:dCMP deaminase [Streptomyces sp. DSM 41921]MDT0390997.1 dCMP deaminase [Streptomyces sp. DSM 41921]